MRPGVERALAVCVAVCVALGGGGVAPASEPYDAPAPPIGSAPPVAAEPPAVVTTTPSAVTAPPPAPRRSPAGLGLELGGSLGGPLGQGAVDAVFSPRPWLSVGGGVGIVADTDAAKAPRYGIFARANLLRRGPFAAGPVLTLSAGERTRVETYQRPQYAADHIRYHWNSAYRLDAGLGAEAHGHGFGIRLEAGMGYIVNAPTCLYNSEVTGFMGSCDAPEIPSYYHFAVEPGRVAPYVSLAVAADAPDAALSTNTAAEPRPTTPSGRATDARTDAAWAAPTALTQPRGSFTVTLYELALPNVTVGLHDRVQLTAGIGVAFYARNAAPWDASIKVAVGEAGPLHLALFAGAGGLGNSADFMVFGAGPVASVCLTQSCETLLSTSVLLGGAHAVFGDSGSSGTRTGYLVSPSAVVALVPHLKLVGETHWNAGLGQNPIWLAALRVPWGPVSVDLGVLQGKLPVGSASLRW
jgi:hypothetical protein